MRTNLLRLAVIAVLSTATAATAAPSDAPAAPSEAARTTTTTTTDAPARAFRVTSDETLSTKDGWNADWAMLFSLNNILVNGNILQSPISGTVGATYFLSDTTAIRGGINLSRQMSAPTITKIVSSTGTDSVTTYQFGTPGITETDRVALRADYLMRLSKGALSPYLGAGLSTGIAFDRQHYVDDVSVVDQKTEVETNAFTYDITARAIGGAEWRFHPNFAIFAEYNLNLTLFQSINGFTRNTVENTVGGVTSTATRTTQSQVNTWLTLNTNLAQGGTLGLEIFF